MWALAHPPGGEPVEESMQSLRRKFLGALPEHVQREIKNKDVDLRESGSDPMSWTRTVSMAARLTDNKPLDGSPENKPDPVREKDGGARPDPPIIDISKFDKNNKKERGSSQRGSSHCQCCYCRDSGVQGTQSRPPTVNYYDQDGGRQDPWAPQPNTGARPRDSGPRSRPFNNGNRSSWSSRRPALPAPENKPKGSETQRRPCCLFCGEMGHTHRECTLRPKCFYCQKRGHMKKDCYQRQNRCILCGADGHTIEECPDRDRGKDPSKPLCLFCKGPHWGRECPRPNRTEN